MVTCRRGGRAGSRGATECVPTFCMSNDKLDDKSNWSQEAFVLSVHLICKYVISITIDAKQRASRRICEPFGLLRTLSSRYVTTKPTMELIVALWGISRQTFHRPYRISSILKTVWDFKTNNIMIMKKYFLNHLNDFTKCVWWFTDKLAMFNSLVCNDKCFMSLW